MEWSRDRLRHMTVIGQGRRDPDVWGAVSKTTADTDSVTMAQL